MSALLAPSGGESDSTERKRLRTVPARQDPPRLAPMPFLVVLIGVLGLGLAGLLMLNTSLQGQAFETRQLQRQESELAYRQVELETKLDKTAAPQELAERASALGLRPNPYPVILRLPEGTIEGDPKRVDGDEVPGIVVKTPAELAAERAEKEAKQAAKEAKKRAEAEAERQREQQREQEREQDQQRQEGEN
ncbi:hypothetical protein [Microlunatus speluncae]|uniref:hypothetical protein n=1 Tax=Microlunatus speluncae TaxID=2594267 RepID=UPI0012667A97|nr:hypothetical protein [Microlunatus speluncae]